MKPVNPVTREIVALEFVACKARQLVHACLHEGTGTLRQAEWS